MKGIVGERDVREIVGVRGSEGDSGSERDVRGIVKWE